MLNINGTLIAIIINFIILVFILNYFLYKPVLKVLNDRKKYIEETLAGAEAKMNASKAFMEEGRETINKANMTAREIIDQATRSSESMKKNIMDQAKKDMEELKGRAKEEIKQYKNEARKSLINDAARLSIVIAEKIIMKKIDKKSTKRMTDDFIESMVK